VLWTGPLQRLVIRLFAASTASPALSPEAREGLDGFSCLSGEPRHVGRLEQAEAMNDSELREHRGSLRTIKSACDIVIPIANETIEFAESLVVSSIGVGNYGGDFAEDSFAQPLKRNFTNLAKHLPVCFRESMRHLLLAV